MSDILVVIDSQRPVVMKEVRRSGRKKVKLNHKKNPLLSKPTKQIRKRLTDFKPNINHHDQHTKPKLSPYQNAKILQAQTCPQRAQLIQNMKEAVKEQQRKLKRLCSVKIAEEMAFSEEKVLTKVKKTEIINQERTQTSLAITLTEQRLHSQDYESEFEVKRDLMEIGTAEELEYENAQCEGGNDEDLVMVEESEFYLAQLPGFKKQSSRLLSDNYENQDLQYTIEHMVPNWHEDLHGQFVSE